MKRGLAILLGIVVLGAAVYFGGRRTTTPGLTGSVADRPMAPEIALVDLQGRKLDLAAYRGKVVLLDFWATWCTPCEAEIPRFIEWQQKYGERGLQVVGISMDDDRGPVDDFVRNKKINYPVAMGDARTGEAYGGVLGLPINFVIGRDGRVYSKFVGATDLTVIEREIEARLR
jgi:cytochrome c biogenesis protein CcmG/thiol:disulfide interchange protein DsbE